MSTLKRKKYHNKWYILPLMAIILLAISWFVAPNGLLQAANNDNSNVPNSEASQVSPIRKAAPQEIGEASMANLCFAISDGYFDEAGVEQRDSQANDTLAFLDKITGQTMTVDGTVGNLEQTVNVETMAFPPGAETLYAVNSNQLGTVNLTNGDFTGLPQLIGTGQGYKASSGSSLVNESFNDVDSLTFDVITGVLWGVDRNGGSTPDIMIQLDPTTGAHVENAFPDPFNPGQFVDFVEVEPQFNLGDIDDMASHPVTGELYAIMNQGGGPSMLVTIDKQTGGSTVVGWYTRHDTGQVISDMEGLSFFNDGQLYGSTGKDFNDLNVLWVIDTDNAVTTAIGEFTDRMIDIEALGCLTAQGYVVVEKSTNGEDADEAPGVYITEGDAITWDYFVRNTGGRTLYDVEVVDDQIGPICTIPQLDVGQSNVDVGVTCQATGTSVFANRPYKNIATVTGNDQADGSGNTYSHSDPSHYYSYRPAAVGDYVWRDTNGNGVQDAFEAGVLGAEVELYDSNGNLVGTTTTTETGFYFFDDLQPGDYTLKFIVPAGYDGFTLQNQGDDAKDSDADPTTGETASFNLVSGETEIEWDAGLTGAGPLASLGDFVWEDLNANGLQDAGEPGIAGATVTLYKIGGELIGTDTTDANGLYGFANLDPGDYFVVFTQPSGYLYSPANAGDNAADSDADQAFQDDPTTRRTSFVQLSAGEHDPTWDAGFYRTGSIGDTIWQDDNANGEQDAGEPGIAGVNVILKDADGNVVATATTDANGNYSFTDLLPGDYTVAVDPSTVPADYGQTHDLDGTLDHETSFALGSGENKDDVDFGYVPANASLGDLVWNDTNADGVQDAGELGIENVTVTLHNASDDSVVGTTTTAADGSYSFTNLPAGEYYVMFDAPAGYAASPQDQGGDDATDSDADPATGKTANITLSAGQNDPTWDAGFYLTGSIGDTVWYDLDGDGEQDPGEEGIPGVTVTLTDSSGNVSTATTDADGKYLFDGLPAGDYTVTVDPSTLPASVQPTYDFDGGLDSTTAVTLGEQENRNEIDFGYQPQGTINGSIWQDNDANGTEDAGEPPLGGVTVILVDDQGNQVATTTTDPDGTYTFPNVAPGDYTVKVDPSTLPADLAQTFDPDGTLDNGTPVTVNPGQTVDDVDFGYVPGASVGDFVWNDVNRDGVQDAGEAGIQGVTVKLYDANDELVGTTTTAADGSYNFTGLFPGSYYLVFDQPVDYFPSPQDAGADDAKDSDADPIDGQTAPFTLNAGDNDTTQDAGFYQVANDSSVGDTVWMDNNGDGVQDLGEPGIAGVRVILLDANGNEVGSVTTDETGQYLFDDLPDGTYTVKVDQSTLPSNLAPTYDLDGTSNPDHEASFPLGIGEDKTDVDFGYQPRSIIGGTIWDDQDPNGTQDPGENGIPGVTVTVKDEDGNVVATTTTDDQGNYSFPDLPPGTYTVTVDPATLPSGVILTFDPDGGDDSIATVTVEPGENKEDVDFGYVQPASLGDFVWNDTNADGIQDAGESGIEGVTVTLFDTNDQMVGTTTTAADGSYGFTNLLPGDYYLVFDHSSPALNGLIGSPSNEGADDAKDSDADNLTGKTAIITLSAGENDDTWDAGFYAGASIGDTVWIDTDGNGTVDDGEAGIPGVTVTLTDPAGNVVATTTTDENGNYVFDDLPPGEYTVTVDPETLPDGMQPSSDPDGTPDNTTNVAVGIGEDNQDTDFGYQSTMPSISLDTTVYPGHDSGASCSGVEKVVGESGDTVTYCYKVTNTGNTPLTNITLDDPALGITQDDMTVLSGDPTSLQPGETVVYYYETTITDDVVNTATVEGQDPSNTPVTDEDPAEVDLVAPAIQIETTVYPGHDEGAACDGTENVTGNNGDPVTYCFTVTNTGDTPLSDVTITDPTLGVTLTSGIILAPGETITLHYDGNINGDLTNTATATGNPTDLDGEDLPGLDNPTDEDPASVSVIVITNDSSVGDKVWQDNNGDGVQDAGEPGISGVKVILLDADGNEVATMLTDESGNYLFDDLSDGTYTVKVDPTTLPGNWTPTYDLDGTSDPDHEATFPLGVSEDKTDVDFGYKPSSVIGGTIWDDEDPNGTQDPGENGIPGVTVTLKDEDGNVVATTTTGPDGSYSFPDLPAGTYTVTVDPTTLPPGVTLSFDPDGGDDSIATVTVGVGENNEDVNFGYTKLASLGDFVWNDTNANGIQDADEPGIEGVTVTLFDSNDQMVGTMTTAADGSYNFTDLQPGDYYLLFDHSSPALDGLIGSPANEGADDAKDSDADPLTGKTAIITLIPGENDETWDAGFYAGASIGDSVWIDTDGNGTQDAGEPGIADVLVTLTDPIGNVVATTTTDSDGKYVFDDLPPGDYTVTIDPDSLPDGVLPTSDPDGTSDNTTDVTVGIGDDNEDIDFGYQSTMPSISLDTTVYPGHDSGASCTGVEKVVGESGDTVTYCYKVTNTGNTPLTNITLDDPALGITKDDMIPVSGDPATLQPGESVVYYYETTITGDVVNTATVEGEDPANPGTPVTDEDPAEVDKVEPAIQIETTVYPGHDNGDSCAGGETLTGVQGSPITYCFEVTNTGDTPLDEVTVTDPDLGITLVSGTPLAPGETVTLIYEGPLDGDLTNTATATGNPIDPSGEDLPGVDSPTDTDPATVAVIAQVSSVGDKVWLDNNGDGVQDGDEPGIPGITMILLDENGNEVRRVTTDENGEYLFDSLPAGTYTVKVDMASLPNNLVQTFDLDLTLDHESTFPLGAGEDKTDVDFGYKPQTTISGTIWDDQDPNGTQDPGENGIPGVTVTVTDENGNPVATTTTDPDGNYSFPDLPPGTYTVSVDPATLPADVILTFDPDGGDDSIATITLEPGENGEVDFGYVQPASLGDFVWNDTNADGIQDAGETGIENVTVKLFDSNDQLVLTTTTAPDGSYSFVNLLPGDYVVLFDHDSDALNGLIASPANEGADDAKDSDADKDTGKTAPITLSAGENDDTWDAGFYPGASIGDSVWSDTNGDGIQDPGEPGIPGVTVTLTDPVGNVVATTTTDGDGNYVFDDLPPGDYTVTIDPDSLPEGVQPTGDPDGGDDNTANVTLNIGDDKDDVDFGYQPAAPSIMLDTTVYPGHDSGVSCTGVEKVVGESGDTVTYCYKVTNTGSTPLTNITLNDPDLGITEDDMTPVSGDPATLQPGESVVYYYETTIGQDVVNNATVEGVDANDPSTTVTDEDPAEVDLVAPAIQIETTVYPGHDDGQSCEDSTEMVGGAPGTPVTYCFEVTNTGDTPLDEITVTDPDLGITLVSGTPLAPGQTVILTYPGNINDDLTNTATATGNPTDPSGEDLPGVDNPTDSDPAMVEVVTAVSSVGDKVWQDNNGDGSVDATEPGLGGVKVILFDADGNEVDSMITDDNGYYLFDNLPNGTYTVKVDPTTLPGHLGPTYDLDGTPNNQTTFPLAPGEDKTDVDFGYQPLTGINGTIWNDEDPNGTQDPGENGIPGVTVTVKDEDGNVVATTTTDPDGNYNFPDLPAGTYTVEVDPTTLPPDVILSFDPDGGDDSIATVTVEPGENSEVNFGYVQPASLGDFVWNDSDANGIQDAGETGIENVTVKLFDSNDQLVLTTTTAADGSYSFTDLLPGDYVVLFDHDSPALDGLIASPKDVGVDDAKDSDADKDTGKTAPITLSAGENDNTLDAGFYPGASITSTVWIDTDGNGTPDAGEPGIPGVTVTLTDPDGNVVDTTTTDSDGNYVFDDLPPGDYTVTIDPDTLPDGVVQTGDPDGTLDNTTDVTLTVGDDKDDVDFGYQAPPATPSIVLDTTVYPGYDSGNTCTGVEKVVGESGDTVTYCYEVTNTGTTPLTNITLDDPDLGITDGDMTLLSGNPTSLQPGESVVYYYETTITQDVVNNATVEGVDANDPSTTVTDEDPAEVDLVAPAIQIETTVYPGHDDGQSCQDSTENVSDVQGAPVTYCFEVTNTGDTPLDEITVTDPDLGITLVSGTPLAPGESVILTYPGNIDDDLTNTATATGNPTDPSGEDLPGVDNPTDDDPASVDEVAPSIKIENTVYPGHDGGTSCEGTEVVSGMAGDPVTYCFVITNDGDTPLSDIELVDPELGVIGNVGGILQPGQSVTIPFSDTIPGDLVNVATVTGNPVDDNGDDLPNLPDVTHNDPSEVEDTNPLGADIDLETTVYPGHDGGVSCEGTELVTGMNGDAVTYCFKVTNTGNTFLNDITIVDPDLGINHTQNVLLPPGATFILSFETTIDGDLVNTATASGNPTDENGADLPELSDPTDTDPAEVNELTPAIQIDNTVYEGHDGGASCEGSELVTNTIGTDVTYCFVVTNTGETPLDEVVITNPDLGITLTLPITGTLAPGESVTVPYESTIINDLVNNASVTGNPVDENGDDIPGAQNPHDSDTSEVNKVVDPAAPMINLEKTVYSGHDGGQSCPGSDLVMGRGGAQATFCFKVTNTGGTYLNNVSVNDPALGINLTHDGILAPNESVVLYAEATIDGDLVNTATATGNPVDENGNDLPGVDDPTDDDSATLDEVAPSIDIQTTVYPGHNDGASCDGSETVAGVNGDPVTYCFTVTNDGDTPLGGITITDPDLGITITIVEPLEPGESITVHYDDTIDGDLTNNPTVTGNPIDQDGLDIPNTDDVTDTDPANVTEHACVTSIGDTIWLDLDGDGFQSDNEPGIEGITVNLVGAGPDGEFNTADDVSVPAQTTGADGKYLFTGLTAGEYLVDVDEDTLPENYALTTGNEPEVITLSECEEYDQADFGYAASVCERGIMYGVNDTGNRNSQLFTLDLGTKVAQPLGPEYPNHDIEAIEIHPITGQMYAIAGGGGPKDGTLYEVDKETGALTAIGTANADDPDEIVSAAFDQQGTLWAFRENIGLVNVDLNTGAATTVASISANWEGLAWDDEGNYLYGSEGRNLYRWDPTGGQIDQMCGADFLPFETEALDFRFDGKMMGGSDKTDDTSLSIFEIDLNNCQILPTDYDITYTDVESLTSETCAEEGDIEGQVVNPARGNDQSGLEVTASVDLNGDGYFALSSTTKTDAEGKYNFANMPDGRYRLSAEGSNQEVEFSLTDRLNYQTPPTITSTGPVTTTVNPPVETDFTIFLPAIQR